MNTLPRAFAQLARHRAAHRKALASRMTRIPMAADPYIEQCSGPDAVAHRARRACQYAGWLGQRDGMLPADLSGLNALWSEKDGFAIFTTADEAQSVAAVIAIPRYILDFDPEAPALALPELAERCAETVDMLAPTRMRRARFANDNQRPARASAR